MALDTIPSSGLWRELTVGTGCSENRVSHGGDALKLHDRHGLQRRARGHAALLPRHVGAANRAHALQGRRLRSQLLVVQALDAVVEVVHFHLLHLALGGAWLAAAGGGGQARAERGCSCDGRFWPAVVLGQTRPWDRGGLAVERSSVT
ncbi:hypothetical protein Nmel_006569, partial [Mimus melanotis]